MKTYIIRGGKRSFLIMFVYDNFFMQLNNVNITSKVLCRVLCVCDANIV